MQLNRDTFVAIGFLLMCGALFSASLQLPDPMFGQISSAVWPQVILVPLSLLSLVLLAQAQRQPKADKSEHQSIGAWLKYYQNPIVCFALFFLFLLTMPVLGMLLGGLAYVFLTLSVLGGWRGKQLLLHAAIAAVFVIGMWVIFTQMLGVFLPEGEILRVF